MSKRAVTKKQVDALAEHHRAKGQYMAEPLLHDADAPSGRETLGTMLSDRKMLQLLREDLVVFTFFRVTYGSQRRAIGTLNQQLFDYSFKGGTAPNKPGLYRYWDVVRGGWRSFYLNNVRSYAPYDVPDVPVSS